MIVKHTSDQRTERIRFGWFTELLADATLLKKTATQNLAISGGNMTALRNAISKLEVSTGAISIDTDEHCKFMLYFYERTIKYIKNIFGGTLLGQTNSNSLFIDWCLAFYIYYYNLTRHPEWHKNSLLFNEKIWIFQRPNKVPRFVFLRRYGIRLPVLYAKKPLL